MNNNPREFSFITAAPTREEGSPNMAEAILI